MSSGSAAADGRAPIGRVVTLGAFILDVLGRPVESIPPGQGSVLLQEIRATAAGTAAGPRSTWLSSARRSPRSARSATT